MPFSEDQLVPFSELIATEDTESLEERFETLDGLLIDTASALSHLQGLTLNDDQSRRVRSGNPVIMRGRDAPLDADDVFATARGKLVAIGEVKQGAFHPRRVFAD